MSDTSKGRFPKSAHLLKHSDFQRVYQQGRRHFSANMTVFYLQTQALQPQAQAAGCGAEYAAKSAAELGDIACGAKQAARESGARIGFTVSKALGGAVERNRMRRRTREAVRHHLCLLRDVSGGVDVVINPKKSLLVAEFAQISQEVERAFGVIRRACENGSAGGSKRSGVERSKRSGVERSKRSGVELTKRSGAEKTKRSGPDRTSPSGAKPTPRAGGAAREPKSANPKEAPGQL